VLSEVSLDDPEIVAQAINLPDVPLDRQPLVVRKHLAGQPGSTLAPEHVGMRARRDEMGVKDRLDVALEPGSLLYDLGAPGNLPSQCLCRRIRPPDLGQEATGVELRENARVDGVGLDLGVCDQPHLLWIGDHDPRHMWFEHVYHRHSVAGRLDHHDIVPVQCPCEGGQAIPAHVDTADPLQRTVFQRNHLREHARDVHSNDPHLRSLSCCSTESGAAGNTTHTDPRSRRIRASREGRPDKERELSAHVVSRPARTCVLPVPRIPDGRTIDQAEQGSSGCRGTRPSHTG
jgi:hypothetical protein